jgi:hypothetical protein
MRRSEKKRTQKQYPLADLFLGVLADTDSEIRISPERPAVLAMT